MSESLEIAAQSLAAILATWLGLTVASRAPMQRGARVFGWVCFLVLVWSVAILVQRTTGDPSDGWWVVVNSHAAHPARTDLRHESGWSSVRLRRKLMHHLLVLYDETCGFCRHTAQTLHALDAGHSLELRPIADYAPVAPTDPSHDALLARLHVRDAHGSWASGGRAFLRIAATLPALAPLTAVARLPGIAWAVEIGYDLVARNRHRLSRWLALDRCRHRSPW